MHGTVPDGCQIASCSTFRKEVPIFHDQCNSGKTCSPSTTCLPLLRRPLHTVELFFFSSTASTGPRQMLPMTPQHTGAAVFEPPSAVWHLLSCKAHVLNVNLRFSDLFRKGTSSLELV